MWKLENLLRIVNKIDQQFPRGQNILDERGIAPTKLEAWESLAPTHKRRIVEQTTLKCSAWESFTKFHKHVKLRPGLIFTGLESLATGLTRELGQQHKIVWRLDKLDRE